MLRVDMWEWRWSMLGKVPASTLESLSNTINALTAFESSQFISDSSPRISFAEMKLLPSISGNECLWFPFPKFGVNSVNRVSSVNNVNSVNSVNSYSSVLPPSPMVFFYSLPVPKFGNGFIFPSRSRTFPLTPVSPFVWILSLWKCEYAARRGLRTAEEKGRDHFNFWSRSTESESDPNHSHLYILWFLWWASVLDKGSVDPKVLAMFV